MGRSATIVKKGSNEYNQQWPSLFSETQRRTPNLGFPVDLTNGYFYLRYRRPLPPQHRATSGILSSQPSSITHPVSLAPKLRVPCTLAATDHVIKSFHCDCLSFPNKIPDLRHPALGNEPQPVAITETWLTPDICEWEKAIFSFSVIGQDLSRGQAGGAPFSFIFYLP